MEVKRIFKICIIHILMSAIFALDAVQINDKSSGYISKNDTDNRLGRKTQFPIGLSSTSDFFKRRIDSSWNQTAERNPRLTILRLMSPLSNTDNCQSSSGLVGSCISAQDCIKRGGRGVETCAWGLGVCCVHMSSCDSTSNANVTYFTSPGYPNTWSSTSGVCTFTIKPKLFSSICQLRLDFEDFYITGPKAGICSTDILTVTGQDLNNIVPVICGTNTGQHMYVQVGSSTGPFRITVTTSRESEERKWRIRVTQIPCGSGALAPAHCLQYLTGAVGRFQSFNFGNIKSPEENTYFLNMNYAICIRKEASMCGATFTADSDFNVSALQSTLNCSSDYLSFGTSRQCGTIPKENLASIRLANTGPMIVTFVSDDKQTTGNTGTGANVGDTGFSFKYTQFSCSSGM
ncbi:hypothetical protein JTE90_028817 [Oedothorax gibbosus]|uniref:CUB domain-containing protein n=1 Tax=Oedothorax gibbosus TaxID=931172 RepID=A0AAV6VX48_9ARAC|nr:hypothetical protein JTE90_028817 [Oedothorax gibbosus]